jgi:hypothetical protein
MQSAIIPKERVINNIHVIRGKKVILDRDLAGLYNVETRALTQAVRRNKDRFPDDFMFQLNHDEFDILKSQIVISSWGGTRKLPLAFTEQGVAMLSSVLKSKRAIHVNILIIKTFVRMREMLETNRALRERIEALERKYGEHNQSIRTIYETLKRLLIQEAKPPKPIGFRRPGR